LKKKLALAFLWMAGMSAAEASIGGRAHIDLDPSSAPMVFAAGEIESALKAVDHELVRHDSRRPTSFPYRGVLTIRLSAGPGPGSHASSALRPEGFTMRVSKLDGQRYVFIDGADTAGAMYGGLELAEQIRTRGTGGLIDIERNPYMPIRGTKFNLPLDLRTPSYSDMSDSAQRNIDTIWDFEFWRTYLDQLARDRYNMVSVWNLHPFPSMVKVPEYPDVALADVWRSSIRFDEDYSTRTTDIVTPAMLAQHEVVRRMTIAEKIEFWRRVMAYAKDRNVSSYVFTWNVYTYGVDGKYGITDDLDNPKTADYFRASVREMFHTYPLLAGIGLTAGENMGEVKMYSGGVDAFDAKENWLFATYGMGLLDAARAEPKRRFRLIHRQHESRAQDIAATFAPLIAQPNVDFDFSFKYAQAHALSSTAQTFHRGYLEQLGDRRTFWTIRNDDALLLRWAAPDFVREFVRNIPYEKTQGFYVGSDMWVWGRTFLPAGATPRLEIDKHWLHFMLWGRLGYDPALDDERIAARVTQRFRGVDGRKLLTAWQDASMIYPLVTGFHWADFDFQWYIEACRSRPGPAHTASGFHSVETFITQPVHPGTDNITIPKYVEGALRSKVPPGTTPFMAADRIDARADAALHALESLRAAKGSELAATLDDIRMMALLGKYYALKIRGATELALLRAGGSERDRALAVEYLKDAQLFLEHCTALMKDRYATRVWTNRVGFVDFDEMRMESARDVDIALHDETRISITH
jgi:hypothetical protein